MFDDGFTVVAITEATGGVAEIGVMPGLVDSHIVGKAEGHAIGRRGQGHQPSLRVQRQQALDRVGDHQQSVGVTRQPQRPTAGVGQQPGGLAVESGANQPAVMQAGDQRIVLQQQRLRPVDTVGANALKALEPLVVGIGAAGERGRRGRRPGDRLHPGWHQQQKRCNGNDYRQHHMMKPDGSPHAVTPAGSRCFSTALRRAISEAADSRSMRPLSSR
ncbi:hypothetical protein D3C73_712190 [compost metagenome]